MTTRFKARYDGRVLIPEEPVDLPVGTQLEVEFKQPAAAPFLELARALGELPVSPELPRDGAAQHDHYLYGTPKRDDLR